MIGWIIIFVFILRKLFSIGNIDIPIPTMQDKTNATWYPYLSVTNFKSSEIKKPAMNIINGAIATISEGKAKVY